MRVNEISLQKFTFSYQFQIIIKTDEIILEKIEESVNIEILVYMFLNILKNMIYWKIRHFQFRYYSCCYVTMATLNQDWPRVRFTFSMLADLLPNVDFLISWNPCISML